LIYSPVFPYYPDLKGLEFSLVVFDGVQVVYGKVKEELLMCK